LGFEKSQRSVTHDSLRYINILTYLLTYLLSNLLIIFTFHHSLHAERIEMYYSYDSLRGHTKKLVVKRCHMMFGSIHFALELSTYRIVYLMK